MGAAMGGLQTPEQTSSDGQGSLSEDGNPTAIHGFAPFQALGAHQTQPSPHSLLEKLQALI